MAALQIVSIAEANRIIDRKHGSKIDLDFTQGVKKNKEDARALALHITNLTEATLKPFESMEGDLFHSSVINSITQLHE